MTGARREARLRALAAVLAVQPDISYLALAERAGVSRRTLYRFAPSREALLEELGRSAIQATEAALARADLARADPLQGIRRLTRDFVADDDLYAYWTSAAQYACGDDALAERMRGAIERYRETMTAFFERGQAEGALRGDLSAEWMIRCYDALLAAASDFRKSSGLDRGATVQLVLEIFLSGALAARTE